MEPNTGNPNPDNQGGSVEKVEITKAELDDLTHKAQVSSQNFERAKTAEARLKELEGSPTKKEGESFDPAKLQSQIDEKVNLRLAGYTPEHIEYMEKYARGAGISLAEAAKDPFVQKAVDGLKAAAKNEEATPPSSPTGRIFNGKPVSEVFKSGSPAEKQAAWETMTKRTARNNE